MPDQPTILTPAEIAQRWKCTAAHIRRMIDNGELPGFRAGGKLLRVHLRDVEAYEEKGMINRRVEKEE